MSKISPFRILSVAGLTLCLAAVVTTPAPAQDPMGQDQAGMKAEDAEAPAAVSLKRIPIPSDRDGEDQPYTIEVPTNWGPRRDLPILGVIIGPPSGDPNSFPEMPLVRESSVNVSDPAAILENLKANAKEGDWSLIEGEVRDFGGVKGLWIVRRLPPVGMHPERISLAVKLPLGDRSLDVIATVPEAQYHGALEQDIKRILSSVRPSQPPEA